MSTAIETDTTRSNKRPPLRQFARIILILALGGLIITGIPQIYALEGWGHFVLTMLGGIESTRILHRFFATLLTISTIFYGVLLAYGWFVLKNSPEILLGWQGWRSLFGHFFANFGFGHSDTNRQFPLRIEAFFLTLSLIILGITGAILLNPVLIAEILPGSLVPIAQSVHSGHALLFAAFIVIWRLAIIILWRPPYIAATSTEPADAISNRRRTFIPIAAIIVVVLGGVIWQYVNYESTAIDTTARIERHVFAPQFVPESGNADIGAVVWETHRCSFCHGLDAGGGVNNAPALPTENLTFEAFVIQVRTGDTEMPAFTALELPDSYLVHLWAWLSQDG